MKTKIIAFTLLIVACSSSPESIKYTEEELSYFTEIAFGAEFGNAVSVIKKWEEDLRIKISGVPTDEDIQTINDIVSDLNYIIDAIDIKIVNNKENVTITFSPESEFSDIEPGYVPKNYGFFWALWHDDNYVIYNASILISTEGINQKERSHLLREELTQGLGLMNDSDKYEDSIFYQDWTSVTEYSKIDSSVIRLLYQESIRPGMTKERVLEILN